MKREMASIQIVIRKAESELHRIMDLLSKRDGIMKDADVVCLLMFRKVIEKIDAVFILHDNGHKSSSDSLARDAFENYVYLAFMIKERYEYRASAYQFQNLIMQLDLIKWFDFNTKKGKKLGPFLNTKKGPLPKPLTERKLYIEKRMEDEVFKNIQVDWKRKEKKSGKYPTWYNIAGGKDSISQLSKFVDVDEEYDTIYSLFSSQVHSLNALSQLFEVENQGVLKPIREDITESLSLKVSESICIRAILLVNGHLDINNLGYFKKWYSEELSKEIQEELKE